jgi:ubiquinol-cytochrome c reductase cytochrome b subunit/menaquinol-cytochrome c reductase cytochrome b/c subunit
MAGPEREQFKLYKKDVERRGKPFFPFAMFHDTVMSLVVVSVIVGLACVWYFDSGEEAGDSGVLGPRYAPEADPGTVSFTPRPDWYFYFLFYLLRIFKWPESVVLGTVGIPTIALILLLVVPFIDRRRERRISRRPVAVVAAALVIASMGILTYKGATAREALPSENLAQVPTWIEENNLIANSQELEGVDPAQGPQLVQEGAEIFAQLTCLNCHSYLGTGGGFPGAPDLSDEGTRGRGIQWQVDHLKCPTCVVPGSPMPGFAALTEDQLTRIAVFLESSKGGE